MKNERDRVVPIIVNGELNDKKNTPSNPKLEKLPTKRYGFSDFLLTLIGLALAVYGVYLFINKEDTKKSENPSSNIVEKSNENKVEEKVEETKRINYEELILMDEVNEKRLFTAEDLEGLKTGLDVEKMSDNLKLALACKIAKKHTIDNQIYILDSDMKESLESLFGNINYTNSSFTYGVNTYTYNQETKRFYLYDDSVTFNLSYKRYDYIEKVEQDGVLILKDFVAYTTLDNTRSTTINSIPVASVINKENIKQEVSKLKYYEYEFKNENGNYRLKKITIK